MTAGNTYQVVNIVVALTDIYVLMVTIARGNGWRFQRSGGVYIQSPVLSNLRIRITQPVQMAGVALSLTPRQLRQSDIDKCSDQQ
jgi:hypothetical protein